MAQRKYLNETGLSYFWGKIKNYLKYRNIIPEQSKTFTDVIGTANSWAGATFFYGSIKPTDWNVLWEIHFRIRTYVPGKTQYDMIADVRISGTQGELKSYASYNTVGTYYPAYYHELYRLKSAGLTNGYGHSLGVRFYSAYSPTDTNYKRTIVVDIFETKNCTFTFYDSCLAYSAIPGTGSTNYNTYSELNYVSNGLQETSDSDTINQNRICYTYRKPFITLYRYQICFCRADGTVLPGNSVDNAPSNINKTLTTEEFDPFGEIYYYNSTSNIATTSNIGTNTLYRQVLADLRYSFNIAAESGKCLVGSKAVYVAAIPQANGMAKFASPALVQDLPTSDDGKIYIYLGNAYPDTYPYRVELQFEHPIYWYKNGGIKPYVGDPNTVSGHTVATDVPSNAVFTDTKNTAGSTDTSSKIFLIGATSQAANPQTYSHDTAYVGTDGKLYSGSKVVLVGGSNASSTVSITPTTTDVYSMTSAGSVTAGTANVPTVINTSKFSGGSFTRGAFSGGSFTQGTDSFTQNTPTVIDTSKFSGGSFTRGAFSGGSFTQGTDSFTQNTPTVIDTSKFSGGSFTRGAFSGGSFTQGTDSFTQNTPTVIDTSKFSGGSFTRGTFSQGTLPTLTFAMDTTDTKKLKITFGQGTLPTHAADTFTAAKLNSGFYTAGTKATFTQGTDSFTAATHAADTFTAAKLNSGFYTAGTKATFTQGTDSFTAATHAADTFTAAKLNSGFYTAGTKATFTQGTDSFTAATHAADSFTAASLQNGFYTAGTANVPTAVTLPGRSSVIKAWTGYSAASAAAQTFTGSSS